MFSSPAVRIEHGGQLRVAVMRYNRPLTDWLDLSTGIAPWSYPLPEVPTAVWQRLPEDDDGLIEVASAYYRSPRLLALPGSQAAIQNLPRLLPPGKVALPAPLYAEHPAAWQAAGHRLIGWEDSAAADYAVLCNPSNPTGASFTTEQLLTWSRHLRLLMIDEAFIDAETSESLANFAGAPGFENIVVLRSLGKFFGLAGLRLGFACGAPAVLNKLAATLGPWAVAHPARWAGRLALADLAWQSAQRQRLRQASQRLAELLTLAGLGPSTGCASFRYLPTEHAAEVYEALAQQGILVRRFDDPPALRFGLPREETAWQRLSAALARSTCSRYMAGIGNPGQ